MFNTDPKVMARMGRHLERVLIADPHAAAAKLLTDLIKDLGARQVMAVREQARAAELAREFDPQLIFIEQNALGFDGAGFVFALRRSDFACRKAPVVMITAEATLESIKQARDAGVHEVLHKPYTTKNLFRRVENVTLKSRLWIEAKMYVGPDRRRFNSGEAGPARRRSDTVSEAMPNRTDAFALALKPLRAALDAFPSKPQASMRAMLEQAAELQAAAFHYADPDLTAVVASLQRYLLTALEAGRLLRQTVEDHAAVILALNSDDSALSADDRRRLAREIATRAAAEQADLAA